MLKTNLFERILIEPVQKQGANKLRVVSGYATGSMAEEHMSRLSDIRACVGIELIVGMTKRSGIELAHHMSLQNVAKEAQFSGIDFSCRYVVEDIPVHAKTYCWLKNDTPIYGAVGSANYTRMGFSDRQLEAMTKADPKLVNKFFLKIKKRSLDCLAVDIDDKIDLIESHRKLDEIIHSKGVLKPKGVLRESVELSLLIRTGETPERSGINWGQREGRERNQAYISLPVDVRRTGFFPDRYKRFTVITDDNQSFIMVRAQDDGKGLHTTEDNSILGKYLRQRIGVELGKYVYRENLLEYGRTSVTFSKMDEETYYMDFSVEE